MSEVQRPIVLVFVKHYLPGFKAGGPLRSVSNLVAALSDRFKFRIVTLDRDYGDARAYPGIEAGEWVRVGDAQVIYLPRRQMTLHRIVGFLRSTQYDILYLNSVFDVWFTALPLISVRMSENIRRPTVVAPRGEFSLGAISLKSWKKRPYLRLARIGGLFRNVRWQASSVHEADDIYREIGSDADVHVAPNLPGQIPPADISMRNTAYGCEKLRVIFLSRISPKKNLDFAIRVLSTVKSEIQFSIVGPTSDSEYYTSCVALSRTLPENITVEWVGSVENSSVRRLMAEHDLFFLPTRGENYGHVVAEALAAGTPVLLSDTTPWRNLHELQVGWDLPLEDIEGFRNAIDEAACKSPAERALWRSAVLKFAKSRLTDPAIVRANAMLFDGLLVNR